MVHLPEGLVSGVFEKALDSVEVGQGVLLNVFVILRAKLVDFVFLLFFDVREISRTLNDGALAEYLRCGSCESRTQDQ